MAASYPGSIKTFTTKTNKVDLVDADHINDLQLEVTAIETELGINVAGSKTDLKTRLAVSIADDGAIQKGTAFPGSPVAMQLFGRTDEDVLYRRNAANDDWSSLTQEQSLVAIKEYASTPGTSYTRIRRLHFIADGTRTLSFKYQLKAPGGSNVYIDIRLDDVSKDIQFTNSTSYVEKKGSFSVSSGSHTLDIYAKTQGEGATLNFKDFIAGLHE